jgi:uncharacterized Zn finger protein
MIDFSNDPVSVLTLTYECQECGTIKKSFDLNTLPELKVPVVNESPVSELKQEAAVVSQAIPIERGPQIQS